MTETKKIARRFTFAVIWIVFITLTLFGLISAGEKTEFVLNGKEPDTIKTEFVYKK